MWTVAVGVRLAAAAALVFGPWTNEPAELAGWDVARFAEIAEGDGIDLEVEYPPGSVLLIESIAATSGDDRGVVDIHRLLIVLSLAVDLGVAAALERWARPGAGLLYLWLGLPLVPAGLLRFDLWASGLGALGLIALHRARPAGFGLAAAGGAAVKLTPALLVPIAFAAGHRKEGAAGVAAGLAVGVGWLWFGGRESVEAVTTLRGATGWHLESIPGSLVALSSDEAPRFEADAYRIGTLQPWLVTVGRALTLAAIGAFAWRLSRGTDSLRRMAIGLLGSTAALIVTAPLLSPQFLLWLTPAAALAWPAETGLRWEDRRQWPTMISAGAIVVTAAVLAAFGPPNLDATIAATALLVRDGLLILLLTACWLALDPKLDDGWRGGIRPVRPLSARE